jgi:phosphoserine aminotransferase
MSRGINFGAGPGALPEEILEEAKDALWDWNGQGMSILEIGHRTEPFKAMMAEAEKDLRDLLQLPKNYHVLFLGGSARVQFAMIPMNFLRDEKKADYLVTGTWSEMAYREAQKYGEPNLVASNQNEHYCTIPALDSWKRNKDAAYFYYTSNETLTGVQFHTPPSTLPHVPLVADMTSDFLSRSIDVSQFGLIFAGSQKNIAPAGLTMVIVHEDYLGQAMLSTPSIYHYELQVENHSLYNTPPTFQVFMAGRMFKWLERQGGLSAMGARNQLKAKLLYDFIDKSDFYHNAIPASCRSQMNVSFSLTEKELEIIFLEKATSAGLLALKGHASTGGLRASLYNAISVENVNTLLNFMSDFEKESKK